MSESVAYSVPWLKRNVYCKWPHGNSSILPGGSRSANVKPFSLRTCLQTPESYIHTYRYEYSESAEDTLIVAIYSDITVCSFPIEANGLTGWRMCFCGRILKTIIIGSLCSLCMSFCSTATE